MSFDLKIDNGNVGGFHYLVGYKSHQFESWWLKSIYLNHGLNRFRPGNGWSYSTLVHVHFPRGFRFPLFLYTESCIVAPTMWRCVAGTSADACPRCRFIRRLRLCATLVDHTFSADAVVIRPSNLASPLFQLDEFRSARSVADTTETGRRWRTTWRCTRV